MTISDRPVFRFPVISKRGHRIPMADIVSYLRLQADNIKETAARCTDPVIVSELQHIGAELREKATEIEAGEAVKQHEQQKYS